MKISNYIYIMCAALALFTACSSDDDLAPHYTVGEADNEIVLRAGISEGVSGVQTRAVADPDANHAKHVAFTEGTKMTLRVDGTWTGHAPEDVRQFTTGTIGSIVADTNGKHKTVSFTPSEQLYWDDYGTADPANKETGRAKGLTIYAVAVDGKTDAAPAIERNPSAWTSYTWNVGTPNAGVIDQTGTNYWKNEDLLTSNNVVYSETSAEDNAYKFDNSASGKLLKFTHAMSKVTVNLTAGAGFVGGTFVNNPTVTLLGFNYEGTVDVETGTSTPTPSRVANVKTHLVAGGASEHTAQFDALVFPGNTITDTETDFILELNADGNIYKVNGTKLYAKMTTDSHGYVLKRGVNYVINIIVNKTRIDVEATIKDWDELSAANETPVINITDAYGHTGSGFERSFDFYRSTAVDGSYLSGITEGNHTVVTYSTSPVGYSLTDPMYWPNHSEHYFFRGIWPLVDSKDGSAAQLGPTTAQMKDNSVEVSNVAYKTGYYPSDLMIGIPRKNDDAGTYDEICKVPAHSTHSGICATEGKIRMNFEYAMSQVVVELTTSTGNDKVIFDDETKVEIVGGYTTGEVKLSDESFDFTGKSVTDYFMHNAAAADYDSYHDAIIPQTLQDEEGNATLKFRITVKSSDNLDKYETVLGIKTIQVSEGGGDKKYITAWERGKKYVYTLRVTKTGIKAEATIKNWVEVTASEDVWF